MHKIGSDTGSRQCSTLECQKPRYAAFANCIGLPALTLWGNYTENHQHPCKYIIIIIIIIIRSIISILIIIAACAGVMRDFCWEACYHHSTNTTDELFCANTSSYPVSSVPKSNTSWSSSGVEWERNWWDLLMQQSSPECIIHVLLSAQCSVGCSIIF